MKLRLFPKHRALTASAFRTVALFFFCLTANTALSAEIQPPSPVAQPDAQQAAAASAPADTHAQTDSAAPAFPQNGKKNTPQSATSETSVDTDAQTADTSVFKQVENLARQRSKESYRSDRGVTPDFLRSLTQQQWSAIQYKPEAALWRDEKLPFELRLYHPGFLYTHSVRVNIVEGATAAELPFDVNLFAYPDGGLADSMRGADAGYAGIALYAPLTGQTGPDGIANMDNIASFLGASYFQGRGKQSDMGLYARGIAVNTALASGEEFPYFTDYWLVKPQPGDTSFTLYALMDSPSMTGAYRIVITPGASVTMDVQCKLFARDGAGTPQKIGLGAITSMYLFSEFEGTRANDYRPEVHGSDGLLFMNEGGGWNWSPLANPARLGISSFAVSNPKGFGLLQRDANFDHYQDLNNRFERRPSLWVEPQSDWGKGHIELIEIPASEDFHANIVAFWAPDKPNFLAENPRMTYRLYWMNPGVTPHSLGKVAATRKAVDKDQWLFVIDFEGPQLNSLPAETGLTSEVVVPEQVAVLEKRLVKNVVTGGWRLFIKLRVPQDSVMQSILTARDGAQRPRISAVLKRGENLPDPLTELWVYDLSI